MTVRSTIPQAADAFVARLKKQVTDAAVRSMHKTGIHGEARAKQIIAQEAYDTGEGLRSVTHEVAVLPEQVKLALFAAAEHMYFVEHGRSPGKWPNLDALTKWVGRKLQEQGIPTRVNITFDQLKALTKTGRKKATAQQKAYRQHLTALYLIGRKIATKGIKEKLIFERLQDELLAYFREDFLKELRAIR